MSRRGDCFGGGGSDDAAFIRASIATRGLVAEKLIMKPVLCISITRSLMNAHCTSFWSFFKYFLRFFELLLQVKKPKHSKRRCPHLMEIS